VKLASDGSLDKVHFTVISALTISAVNACFNMILHFQKECISIYIQVLMKPKLYNMLIHITKVDFLDYQR